MTKHGLKITPQSYTEEDLIKAFPDVDPGFAPFGSRLVVQLRSPKTITSGGIELPSEAIETEMWNTQIAKVRAIGPVAFCNRNTLEKWPEGDWCQVGDYIRIPKYNQDKWFIETQGKFVNPFTKTEHDCKEYVLFMLINDLDILAKKLGNPLEVKAYI